MTNEELTREGEWARGMVPMGSVDCSRCGKPSDRCLCDVQLVSRRPGAAIYRLAPEQVLLVLVPLGGALAPDDAPPGFPMLVTYCVESVVEGAAIFDRPVEPRVVDGELLYRMGPAAPARQRLAGVVAELLAQAAEDQG